MKPSVSIITPTRNRQPLLPLIARCVAAQDHRDLEWLILDDSPEPWSERSGLDDPRFVYRHAADRLSIGEKRNRLIEAARGELIVHFDDDDYYAPNYVSRRVAQLTAGEWDLVGLTGFFAVHAPTGAFGYCETTRKTGFAFEFGGRGIATVSLERLNIPLLHLAYGWAYAYRRELWEAAPLRPINAFEDREFVRDAMAGGWRIGAATDRAGLAIHIVHGRSTSRSFPQYLVPPFLIDRLMPGAAGHIGAIAGRLAELPVPA